jgi:3-deoxy-D-manno-octulosonic-acid transferase
MLAENCSKHGLTACFASIHEGELTILIDAMLRLRRQLPNIQFVLVPRHPAKLEKYVSYLRRHDINFVSGNYQTYTRCEQPLDTFVVDSIGELLKFYSASDVAFVGGSIVPLGGQNLLEPIGVGVPVITGTSLYNFQEIADALISLDIIVAVSDAPSIAKEIWHLLEDGQERESRSARGRDWLISKRGATQRAADALRLFL